MRSINCTVSNVQEYLEAIYEVNNTERDFIVLRDYFYYRGQANCKWELMPSLGRERKFASDISIFNDERNLIETAKYNLPNIFKEDMLPLDLLATLQHYGIPTRLLDVTKNPLVALYFACTSEKSYDGEVIVFHEESSDVTNYPIIHGICESYKFSIGTWTYLNHFYDNIIKQPYFVEQIARKNSIDDGANWIEECCRKISFVQAKTNLDRQRLQQGAYILFNNQIKKQEDSCSCFCHLIEPIPKNHESIKSRIEIKSNSKVAILKQLEIIGISEKTLFADNIDIVCKNILLEYSLNKGR